MKKVYKILLITGIIVLALSIIYVGAVMAYTLYLNSRNPISIIGDMDILVSFEIAFMLYPFPTVPLILGAVSVIISIILKKISGKNQESVIE